ncbi:hypothetical protein G5V58_21155 [Nocardioides anomalus]|uniref:Uncharacterized protein n=1 Tax=Nocardioides anomalus TaxID=2712223 RepID=A0A6G6WI95_9ACTN|nr:hypothetical protein [Nocardioides anomalus]QIG44942.1 hypothetical protein G5V58_21155 [Nocardioides anomalus]
MTSPHLEQSLLNASLVVAPVAYLAADTTYAARGWDDGAAGVLAVLASIAYAFLALRVASWLPEGSLLRIALVAAGLVGCAGAVAYGFDSIHTSYGDVELVDRSGAATLIKPLGLFFPLALVLEGAALLRLGARVPGLLAVLAGLAWPVAHIGNLAPLAVGTNVVLVLGFGSLLWQPPTYGRQAATASRSTKSFIG